MAPSRKTLRSLERTAARHAARRIRLLGSSAPVGSKGTQDQFILVLRALTDKQTTLTRDSYKDLPQENKSHKHIVRFPYPAFILCLCQSADEDKKGALRSWHIT